MNILAELPVGRRRQVIRLVYLDEFFIFIFIFTSSLDLLIVLCLFSVHIPNIYSVHNHFEFLELLG